MTHDPASPATPPGEVRVEGDQATLFFRRHLSHPPEAVWAALTESDRLTAWFMESAKVDGRPGGAVDMIGGPARMHWTGPIRAWDPPRVFEYEWNIDPRPELPAGERSLVRWELEPDGAGTRLTLTHSRLTRPTALGFAPGTHAFLDRLDAYLAGRPLPHWFQRYDAVRGLYPAWDPKG